MAAPKEQPKHSGISAQLFELLKVVFTLVLTGIVGGGITYYYQNRSHREQQETKELETARQCAGVVREYRRLRAKKSELLEDLEGASSISYSTRSPRSDTRAVWPRDAEAFLR